MLRWSKHFLPEIDCFILIFFAIDFSIDSLYCEFPLTFSNSKSLFKPCISDDNVFFSSFQEYWCIFVWKVYLQDSFNTAKMIEIRPQIVVQLWYLPLELAFVCRPCTLISIWTLLVVCEGFWSLLLWTCAQERPSEGSCCYSVYLHKKVLERFPQFRHTPQFRLPVKSW